MNKNLAIIFAGGVGKRMQTGGLPKQFLAVNEKPILIHTLEHFQSHSSIDMIILVMVADWIDYTSRLIDEYNLDKVACIVPGGTTGQDSIYRGLCKARDLVDPGETYEKAVVLLHDGVRPIIDADLITANIEGVRRCGSAITCVPNKETVVVVDEAGLEVDRTVERRFTRIAKAPQSFYLAEILAAHEKALAAGETNLVDSCTLMQLFSDVTPSVIEGSYDNIKITTPEDYYTLKTLLDLRAGILEDI